MDQELSCESHLDELDASLQVLLSIFSVLHSVLEFKSAPRLPFVKHLVRRQTQKLGTWSAVSLRGHWANVEGLQLRVGACCMQTYHTAADRLQLIPVNAKRAAGIQYEITLNRDGCTALELLNVDLKVCSHWKKRCVYLLAPAPRMQHNSHIVSIPLSDILSAIK